ncbi:MAG: glycosyltransferase family 2 protein [Betaproteobacteria bacterium]
MLIPLYNHERFINRALDSLLSSDCSQIELIIADDFSSDQSLSMAKTWLEQHQDKFFRTVLIANERNLGITANLNNMIEQASGEFISALASDDMLAKHSIDNQKRQLMCNASIDFVFVNCAIIDIDDNIIKKSVVGELQSKLLASPTYTMLNVLFNWNVIWSRLFARRKRFIEFGRYIEKHTIEDRWSALKIMNTHRYSYLHEIGYLYRFRGFEAHPAINSDDARYDFHRAERLLHPEAKGLLYVLLWIRRLPFRTNRGKWPCRLNIT